MQMPLFIPLFIPLFEQFRQWKMLRWPCFPWCICWICCFCFPLNLLFYRCFTVVLALIVLLQCTFLFSFLSHSTLQHLLYFTLFSRISTHLRNTASSWTNTPKLGETLPLSCWGIWAIPLECATMLCHLPGPISTWSCVDMLNRI